MPKGDHTLKNWKKLSELLENWTVLNENLAGLHEHELKQLLEMERTGKKRVQMLIRIHGRFNKVRAQREREELLDIRKKK